MEEYKTKISISEDDNINDILDKLLKLKESQKEPSHFKKVVHNVSGICIIMITGLICVCIYKNNFTIESILATLLAFFSIFISIFFYFKADETSTRFYDSSYKFMKDISVTLGKIEERFGEKLNSLNEKISHFDNLSRVTSEEIEEKKDDKANLIEQLMEKANLTIEQLIENTNLTTEEKANYKRKLEEKDKEIEQLKENKFRAEHEAAMLRDRIRIINENQLRTKNLTNSLIAPSLLIDILKRGKIPENLPIKLRIELINMGLINSEGYANKEAILNILNSSDIA